MNKKRIGEIITNIIIVILITACILFCTYQSYIQFDVIENINGRIEKLEQVLKETEERIK